MSRPLAGKKVQPPGSVIGAPVMAVTCSTVSGHGLSALTATGAGAEAAGTDAVGASAVLSPLLHAAIDTDTIPAHIQPNSLESVMTVSPRAGRQRAAMRHQSTALGMSSEAVTR